MTIEPCEPGTRQATPRPVPGPSTAIGAPHTDSPSPSRYKSAAVRYGKDNAAASKSLQMWIFARPNAAHSSCASIVQGQLVSTQRSSSTGPAAASTASWTDNGRPLQSKKALTTSVNRGNCATVKYLMGPSTPFDRSANLALVAPTSPNSTCS